VSVFWRYWLLQIPGWVVLAASLVAARHYVGLTTGWAVLLFGLWLLKDAALYPWLRRHYAPREEGVGEALRGRSAVAQESIAPSGYVKLGGELWRAEVEDGEGPVDAGEQVVVEAVEGLTLRVRRRGALKDSTAPRARSTSG
jgi:membrane protein implicated in regulation of membrane protease activity